MLWKEPWKKLFCVKHFVNLKSNSALLNNKGHKLLTSPFPPKKIKIFKFPFRRYSSRARVKYKTTIRPSIQPLIMAEYRVIFEKRDQVELFFEVWCVMMTEINIIEGGQKNVSSLGRTRFKKTNKSRMPRGNPRIYIILNGRALKRLISLLAKQFAGRPSYYSFNV